MNVVRFGGCGMRWFRAQYSLNAPPWSPQMNNSSNWLRESVTGRIRQWVIHSASKVYMRQSAVWYNIWWQWRTLVSEKLAGHLHNHTTSSNYEKQNRKFSPYFNEYQIPDMEYLKNESCKGCLNLTALLMSVWDGDIMHKPMYSVCWTALRG
jgi:hypothetical protein